MTKRIVADGAMGTRLIARTGFNGLPAELNLAAPQAVLALHREYVEAGACLLLTNTLRATPEAASAGVALAIQALHSERSEGSSLRSAAVAGGQDASPPASPPNHMLVGASLAAAPAPTEDLVEALAPADLLILETVTSLAALEAAVQAIRGVTNKPIWATFSFDANAKLDGRAPADVARNAQRLNLAAFGYGCGLGLGAARQVLAEFRKAAPAATLVAKPNLGLPRDGRYDVTPDETANWARDLTELRIDVIGLCCGSTPAHIRAIAGLQRFDC